MCYQSSGLSQISAHFVMVLELPAMFIKAHPVIPKWPWTLKPQKYPRYVLLVLPVHRITSKWPWVQIWSNRDPIYAFIYESQFSLRFTDTE